MPGRRNGDHPRVCGEKTPDASSTTKSIGSPPRMRGKVCRGVCGATGLGITPAYAGKRAVSRASWSFSWDHPRVCGEKKMPDNPATIKKGITPAYAGKRRCWAGCKLLVWDHPRVCGEKPSQKSCGSCPAGSPPRMQGKAWGTAVNALSVRITPAYTGKRDSITQN